MPTYTTYMLGADDIAVSGGASLSGFTQGDGSHLVGRTITLNSNAWTATQITDDDGNFDDNDGGQRLDGAQTINGVTHASGTVVEAEYRLILTDPETGQTWTVIGYNLVNSSPAYGTIEGLAFIGDIGGFPPVGRPLTVTQATEGPGSSGIPATAYGTYASPPCLTPGTRIATPDGPRRIEDLSPGDAVLTRDHGAQILRWVGRFPIAAAALRRHPQVRPVRIRAGALGPGLPARDLVVSPQHRLLVSGWRCEMHFGEPEMLVAACHLAGLPGIASDLPDRGVTYMHLLFDRHEVIRTEGVWTESLYPGALDGLSVPAFVRAEMHAIRSAATTRDAPAHPPLTRPALGRAEARLVGAVAAR